MPCQSPRFFQAASYPSVLQINANGSQARLIGSLNVKKSSKKKTRREFWAEKYACETLQRASLGSGEVGSLLIPRTGGEKGPYEC